ncbi:MAG: SurA N-terminal domain-containing protein [Treponema sp.]|jgi:hypothetical protein|nr:SurA N-terminal domain-containing protein [Treponema sp.]
MAFKAKKQVTQEDTSAGAEFIRRFKANPFIFIGTIVILIIVIVAFVLVPAIVPAAGGPSVDLSFGSYNKVPLTYVPGNYFAQVRENIARYQQPSVDDRNYFSVNYQIWREAFEETVVHTAILQEMNHAGYTAPVDVVDREVAQLPQFQENGRFSTARYRQLDNTTRMSLWRQVQDSIAIDRYNADMTNLRISSKEGPFIKAMASPERTFDMAAFPLSDYPDTEVIAYTLSNPGLFQVTHLSKIAINSSEREARQILATVQEGTQTFEDAARTHSQDGYAEKGGDMGIKLAYELSTEVPDATERESVIGLAKGAYSPIVKVPSGWAFFRAEDAPHPADTGDAALVAKIRVYITEFERGRMEDFFVNQADALIGLINASGFDAALAQQGLSKRHFGPLPLNYGRVALFTSLASFSVSELTDAVSNENFWQTAFSTPLNTPSKPLVIGNNVVVLYPLEETPADETNAGYIETAYSSYWLSYILDQNVHSYFLTNEKLEDRFFDAFFKYIQPLN